MKTKCVGRYVKAVAGWLVLCAMASGCGPDVYATCDLDPASEEVFQRECARNDIERSCAVENFVQCDTRVCARYNGSQPFCTSRCTSDADCGEGGRCEEFVLQTGQKYCVNDAVASVKLL